MAAIRQTFYQECDEGLADLEAGLLRMEEGDADAETVNAVFRAVHSIKGGAGAFSLDALVRFAHVFETTLDDVRAGRLPADGAVIAAMLRANDVLADLVAAARDSGVVDEGRVQAAVAELQAFGDGEGDAEADDDGMGDFVFQPLQVAPLGEPAAAALPMQAEAAVTQTAGPELIGLEPPGLESSSEAAPTWTLHYAPTADLYAKANDTLLLLRELASLGRMTPTLDAARLPLLPDLDPEASYLTWTLRLETEASETAIREVFEFVDGDCELKITQDGVAASDTPEFDIMALIAKATAAAPALEEAAALPAPAPVAAALSAAAPVPVAPPAAVVAPPRASVPPPAAPPAGPSASSAETPAPAAAEARKADAPAAASGPAPSIRVDLERVDRLIDLVGELVINQAMLTQRIFEAGLVRGSEAVMALDELEHLTRDIQDSVMAIRAQPVKSVFQRMPRLVREVAAMVGKQVRLVTEGEATEVDKTVIERLSEPLTHMIRNSIDHGIESAEKRLAAGKPAEGVVRLAALHRSGRIVIEVADDGAGINRPRVRQIAIDKGLIAPDAPLSDEETDNLIFMAGFSTAETISDVSGRGVGMDVVRRSIQALGGRISIVSRPGQGSTFTLSLPLTLAVLDGMVVSVGDQTLVAPLTAMIESLQPTASQVHAFGEGRVVNIRDAYLPLIDVGVTLGYRRTPIDPADGVALLVEAEGGARAALLVDAIQGQRQVVIKSLESNFRHVPGIAAATILGDGRVALILDVDAVVSRGKGAEAPRIEAPRVEAPRIETGRVEAGPPPSANTLLSLPMAS